MNNLASPGFQQPSGPDGEPLVSVIIPVYKSAPYVVHALNSVLAQTFSRYEVILENDGSPDTELLEQLLKPYLTKIRYIKQDNRGPSGARNAAILEARGDYVAFLDSDDLWLPHHLETQLGILQKDPSLSLVYSNSFLLEDDIPIGTGFKAGRNGRQPVTFETQLTEDACVSTSSVVARRQAILEAGFFDVTLRRCEDFDLWLRMAHCGFRMDYDSAVQICYRRRSGGLGADHALMMRARIEVYEKATSLSISPAQRELISQQIARVKTELDIQRAKTSLRAREYDTALEAAKRASAAVDSWKLRLTVLGMRSFPRLFAKSYRVYDRLLRYRRRKRVRGFE
jgi:glycosyltransferase involved in cell wall biosynthesis